MSDVKWQRKSAETLLKQQLQESKQLQEFLELEKSQLKRVVQQMEIDWQQDRARLEKDQRKLEKAQQFYAKQCNSKLSMKKKLAEKEALRQKMKCELQQMNYKVMSVSNEIQIERAHVVDLEAVSDHSNCLDVDCELQLLGEVSGQLEQATDEVQIAKERVKRTSQELGYLMCQLTEMEMKVSPLSSGDESKKQAQKNDHVNHVCTHFDASTNQAASADDAPWKLSQPILGAREKCSKLHKCNLPRSLPEKLPYIVESETQTEVRCGRTSPMPCIKESVESLPKAKNSEQWRRIPPSIKHYVTYIDQTTSCNIPQYDLTPVVQSLEDLHKIKSAAAKLEFSTSAKSPSPELQQDSPEKATIPCDYIIQVEPQPRTMVAVCDATLQCSSEPVSEHGGGTISASSSDVPYTSQTSTSPRTPNFIMVTRDEPESRNKPSPRDDREPVMRTPPLRQPIQLTICQQFYQPLRPIRPPVTFARTSTSLPRGNLFYQEPMPPLTLAESPEHADVCIGTSPIHSPVDNIKCLTDNLNAMTQQLITNITTKPQIYQAELACSSDSSRSQAKTTRYESNNSTSVSPIRAQEFLTSQYHMKLDISDSGSSNSDLESIEIVEIGTETLPLVQCQSGNFFLPEDQRYLSQVSYKSDV